jgi:hypothetical protein
MEFSRKPLDFEMPTLCGPFFAVPNADDYEVRFPVLKYLNEHESATLPDADASPLARDALRRLRMEARSRFAENGRANDLDPSSVETSTLLPAAYWYASGLPYYEDEIRTQAMQRLRVLFRDHLLLREHFEEALVPEITAGTCMVFNPLKQDDLAARELVRLNELLLEAVWAYIHYSGDFALARERWALLRRLLTHRQSGWAQFGAGRGVELGRHAPPVIAFGRLAYLAGDLQEYHRACGLLARELVLHYVKEQDLTWFRNNQPWHSLEPLRGEIYLTHVQPGAAGWQMDGPAFPAEASERLYERRWFRFLGTGVSRFYRERLQTGTERELARLSEQWDPARRAADQPHEFPSLVRLQGFLSSLAATNVSNIATPEELSGTPSGVIASCIAMLRATQPVRHERLIPGAPLSPFLGQADAAQPHVAMVHELTSDNSVGATSAWPRILWSGWKTPTGHAWNFGEVRAGTPEQPGTQESLPVNRNAVLRVIRPEASR